MIKHTTTNQSITIFTFFDELSQSLKAGWEKLKSSQSYKVYSEAFDFFKKVGLYEGLFRPDIPNPVYDNAAKELGKEFLNKALEVGLYFKELFPGDFNISTENVVDGLEYRIFYLTAYHNGNKLGTYKLSFSHSHRNFDFPAPPILEIDSVENLI